MEVVAEVGLIGIAELESQAREIDVGIDQHPLRRFVHPVALQHPLRPHADVAAKQALECVGNDSVAGGELLCEAGAGSSG